MTNTVNVIIKEADVYMFLIIRTLEDLPKMSIARMVFLVEIIILFLSIRGRINFLLLSRFGKRSEQSYRKQFEKKFAIMDFNKELTLSNDSVHYVIAFDPSYIKKSGRETPGAGKCKRSLKIWGITAIDVGNHTAFHLEAVQTLRYKGNEEQTLLSWYADVHEVRKEKLKDFQIPRMRRLVFQETFRRPDNWNGDAYCKPAAGRR